MKQWIGTAAALALAGLAAGSGSACSLCGGPGGGRQTWRQEAGLARLILFGTLADPRLAADPTANGSTDLRIEEVVKDDPARGGKQVIVLPRYVPVDAKAPPRYLIFCDAYDGKLDPYRGVPVKDKAAVAYLKEARALDPKDGVAGLRYFFKFLDAADPEVAADAFLELARASDAEIDRAAAGLDPAVLRKLLGDAKTPPERLGLFAFLLGACGQKEDADLLARMVQSPPEHARPALGGLLAGYIRLRPAEGWKFAQDALRDGKRPVGDRLAVLSALRFHHNCKPDATKAEVLKGLAALIAQGELADLAVEDLRRWKWWDLTEAVLAHYGRKEYDSPLVRRAVVRYALCCPRPEAAAFVAERRRTEAELVNDVREALEFETAPVPKGEADHR